jgi:enamine deaminase RidA (YjgF/YER057c/UK114 family)
VNNVVVMVYPSETLEDTTQRNTATASQSKPANMPDSTGVWGHSPDEFYSRSPLAGSIAGGQHALMAGNVENRLRELGLSLPASPRLPPGVTISFEWVRIRGSRAFVSGHGPLDADGAPAGPFGKVPSEVSFVAAQESARLAALAVIAGLRQAIIDLDRITAWVMVNGFVNAEPGFGQTTLVLNPFSELIIDVFGAEVGAHARTAIGVAAVPLNLPLVVSAEVEFT